MFGALACNGMNDFRLNSRLQADTLSVGDQPLSRMLLMNDARYPWAILVPRITGATEIHHLSERDRQQLMIESCELSEFITQNFPVTKMNVAVLGNIVPQLHMHHIGRNETDPAWPGPVWGHSPAVSYEKQEAEKLIKLFQQLL